MCIRLLVVVFFLFFSIHSVHAIDGSDIQKQIDALPTAGGTVQLSDGEYLLTTAHGSVNTFPNGSPIQTAILISKDNVTLQGQGSSTILKLAPHAKMRAISVTSKNVTVRNLVVDGNKTQRNGTVPYPDGDVVDGLLYASQSTSNVVFENLEVKNGIEDAMGSWKGIHFTARGNYNHDNGTVTAGAAGISLSGVLHGEASNNRIENNTATGIWSSFDAQNIQIRGNTIRNNIGGGITIGGGDLLNGLGEHNSGFAIRDNTLSGNGTGVFPSITVFASKNGSIEHNTIESSPYDNIQINGTPEIVSDTWTITRNICTGPIGIRSLGDSRNIVLQSNACQTNIPQISLLGDLDINGTVDIFDYNILVSNFGKTGSFEADIDKNGTVDIFDYNLLIGSFETK